MVEDSGDIGIACGIYEGSGIKLLKKWIWDMRKLIRLHWIPGVTSEYWLFRGTITTNNMSLDEANTCNTIQSKVLEYMTNNAVDFIKGDKDIP